MSKFVWIKRFCSDREILVNIDQISTIIEKYDEIFNCTIYRINMANREVYEDISKEEFKKLQQHLNIEEDKNADNEIN